MTMQHSMPEHVGDPALDRLGRLREKASALPPLASGLRSLAATAVYAVKTAARRSKMRRDMLTLSDDQLRDVGLSRDAALREAERIAWRGDWT